MALAFVYTAGGSCGRVDPERTKWRRRWIEISPLHFDWPPLGSGKTAIVGWQTGKPVFVLRGAELEGESWP